MITPNIELQARIELGDLVYFISEAKGLTYDEAERLVPPVYFEGSHICEDNKEDWCKEVVEYLHSIELSAVDVYQD